ncbi:centrosome-associated protein CEP250-like [Limanda limanda]|uniref:centrosome-associated protein CEP250-like n=1 Tax=Limanda limanda TaxID=27771 RepID=UPI0029C78F8C|nr:centrosome-associated protein CEP250-like [Limanda limanda]
MELQERAELQWEVCRLQEKLAESQAEREELESRSRALNDRAEQREWRRRASEGREREARQALLIHRLQNKQRIRDEHSDSLESALIRLEEEQQRSLGLVETNALLREQLGQSEQANQSLRQDLKKLTDDWSRAVEEAGQREDLWQLRTEFSRLSSSLLSSYSSASEPPLASSCSLGTFVLAELEQRREEPQRPLQETEVSQLKEWIVELSHSLQEEHRLRGEREREGDRHRETERSLQSVGRAVVSLSRVLSSCSRSVCVSSDSVLSLDLSSLLSVLAQTESALLGRHQELQGAELSLRRLSEENTTLHLRLKQLEDDNQQLQTHTKHTQLELTHTLDTMNRERQALSTLLLQVEEVQKREEELRRENIRLKSERDRQEERSRRLETETHRRVQAESLENVQLTERDSLQQMEIHALKGALEREQLDRQRAEEEAADARDALQKSRECVVRLSSLECALKREVEEGRGALDKMAALNSALTSEKQELIKQLLQLECELSDSQSQLHALRSEVSSLHKQVKTLNSDCSKLRAHKEEEADTVHQLRARGSQMERLMEEKERELASLMEEREKDGRQQEEVEMRRRSYHVTQLHLYTCLMNEVCGPQMSSRCSSVCAELQEAQEQLQRAREEERKREQEDQERESRRQQEDQVLMELRY